MDNCVQCIVICATGCVRYITYPNTLIHLYWAKEYIWVVGVGHTDIATTSVVFYSSFGFLLSQLNVVNVCLSLCYLTMHLFLSCCCCFREWIKFIFRKIQLQHTIYSVLQWEMVIIVTWLLSFSSTQTQKQHFLDPAVQIDSQTVQYGWLSW